MTRFRSRTDYRLTARHTEAFAYEWPNGTPSLFPSGDGVKLRLRVECVPSMPVSPVNRILAELRDLRGADWARPERYSEQYAMFLRFVDDENASSEDNPPWTTEERDHARKVLTKLAASEPRNSP